VRYEAGLKFFAVPALSSGRIDCNRFGRNIGEASFTLAGSDVAMASLYANLEKASPYILSILRIVAALLFLEHGLQKYFAFPSAGPPMTPLLYVQGAIEIIGPILLVIGAYTRVVAFILAGDMAVAYFMAHFPRSFYPAVNGGDAAVLYCFVFLFILFAGGGPWSVDRALLKHR
jgi:putative oxidoreductase